MRNRIFTDEEIALLNAIHANPSENSLRLAYADWLEQHAASEYAEFIRLHCSPDNADSDRAKELQYSHGPAWAKPFPKSFHITYERGLPITWLQPNLWTLDRLTKLIQTVSPRLRFILMLKERTLFHRVAGEAVFDHPIMGRVARFRVCPAYIRHRDTDYEEKATAFVKRLASFRLPNTAEEINFMKLPQCAELLARQIFEPRFRVTVQFQD